MLLSLVLVAALDLGVWASPLNVAKRAVPESHVLHERHEPHWGKHWSKRAKVPAKTLLPVRIGLKHSNDVLRRGHDRLMEISDPSSKHFGKHMTPEEVIDFFAPSDEGVDAIIAWVTSSGINRDRVSLSANKQWIQFDADAGEAENLFYAEYFVWEHGASGNTDIASEEYHVPSHLRHHVDYVMPGIRLMPSTSKRGVAQFDKRGTPVQNQARATPTTWPGFPNPSSTNCNPYVAPGCIKAQYGIPNGTTARSGNQMGIYSSSNEHYSVNDLNQYWAKLYPTIPQGTKPQDLLIDGAVGPANPSASPVVPIGSGETDLDVQMAWPIIWPQKVSVYQVDDQWYEFIGTLGTYNTFLDALDGSYCSYSAFGETGDCTLDICKDPVYPDTDPNAAANGFPASAQYSGTRQCGVFKPTNVISISYALFEYLLPAFYLERQCNEWMKLGLQGVTVVAASGDSGVGENFNCWGPQGNIFTPTYTSTCPYILSVGATEIYSPGAGQKLAERASTSFPSGGGFSNVFDQPSYQSAAVSKYLSTTNLPFGSYTQTVNGSAFDTVTSGSFRRTGRAYPDVSAVGQNILLAVNGKWLAVNGTSASTPIWGGMLTLINEARLAAGKSTLGFINPTLYAHPEIFNDITIGDNKACEYSDPNTGATTFTGFPAAAGWDPVTGLGTPKYSALYNVLTAI